MDIDFALYARYNQWINRELFTLLDDLESSSLNRDRGAYFRSIMGTLNHILVGDIIWLKRFSCHPKNFISLNAIREYAWPGALSTQLYTDKGELGEQREKNRCSYR